MGLDQYLYKRSYVGNKYRDKNERVEVVVPKKQKSALVEIGEIKSERISSITEDIGYWRKANQIHRWFVENVQKGEDNCGEYHVTIDQLKELLEKVEKVLKDHRLAPLVLPVQEGFFFGPTDYEEYYFENLEDTKAIIESILKEDNRSADYYYSSSW